MTNKEIARSFDLLAKLMELHGESSYKIRAYSNAYRTLRSVEGSLMDMTRSQLKQIKGVGDAIAGKIQELQQGGEMRVLKGYKDATPQGIQELLLIKGLGVKKIKQLWYDLQIESPGELLYACTENRLQLLKGFGKKSQQNIQEALQYYMRSKNKFLYAQVEELVSNLAEDIELELDLEQVYIVGGMRRALPVLERIELLLPISDPAELEPLWASKLLRLEEKIGYTYRCSLYEQPYPVYLHVCAPPFVGVELIRRTGNADFVTALLGERKAADFQGLSEEAVFEKLSCPFIPPVLRESASIIDKVKVRGLPDLVERADLRGLLHAHSTYSDGGASLKAMAQRVREEGYGYFGITDHSQSAFYANGLKIDRVFEQFEEIKQLNAGYENFKIFKGIESDILYDGQLDYDRDMLAQFDFIIASVHAHLRMDEKKATDRLLRAIENPYTYILGHPTGRLLLARQGYPIDHKAVIEACAQHKVAIELNANPNRLDLDWTWLHYAMEQGVPISINPDAHSLEGIQDVRYGLLVAQKAGVEAGHCLNSMETEQFEEWLWNR